MLPRAVPEEVADSYISAQSAGILLSWAVLSPFVSSGSGLLLLLYMTIAAVDVLWWIRFDYWND